MQDYKYNRVKRSKYLDDIHSEERQQYSRQYFISNTHYVTCDTLFVEIQKRRESYIKIGFLFKEKIFNNEIMTEIKTLMSMYENEILGNINFEKVIDAFAE